MDGLIVSINKIQSYNQQYSFIQIDLPEIIVVGSQSSGKSSILERIIGYDILPKGSDVATRCPIILQMIHDEYSSELTALFYKSDSGPIIGVDAISAKLQEMTNAIGENNEGVTELEIIIQIKGDSVPTLTLVDLPGLIKNDGELPLGSADRIQKLVEGFVAKPNTIILAISAANVHLANSDSIQVAHKYDPKGQRTFHVITKIDLMDPGTNAINFLNSDFVKNSLGTVFIVNRSKQDMMNKKSIIKTNEDEQRYLQDNYRSICSKHGIKALVANLVQKLMEEIQKHLPNICRQTRSRINNIKTELENYMIIKQDNTLNGTIIKFVEKYKDLIGGDQEYNLGNLEGGALISHVLYENYLKQMKTCSIAGMTPDKILLAMKNTTGNKKMSYSVEKPFQLLIRNEMNQFQEPSFNVLIDVRNLLVDFVQDIIREMKIDEYFNLVEFFTKEITESIEEKYEITRTAIRNLIKCESIDVFCIHPNNHLYQSIKNDMVKQGKPKDESMFDKVLKTASFVGGLTLPPSINAFLNVSNNLGMFGKVTDKSNWTNSGLMSIFGLKPKQDTEDQFYESMTNPAPDQETGTDESPNLPFNMDEVLNFLGTNPKASEVFRSVNNVINGRQNDFTEEQIQDIITIEDMVLKCFDMKRQIITDNVPKWIQMFMINDLLDEILNNLLTKSSENKQELFKVHPRREKFIEEKKEELQELEEISRNLRHFEF